MSSQENQIREIRETSDGSHTLYMPGFNEHYHSAYGAIQESKHVFIKNGLLKKIGSLEILEIGLGTGLNALLTLQHARDVLNYTGLELYPLKKEVWEKLNYPQLVQEVITTKENFSAIHQCSWDEWHAITHRFHLFKWCADFTTIDFTKNYDLVYFDAFAFEAQQEMWKDKHFRKLCNAMKTGGILVTYAAKGSVRRAMQQAGFEVERLAGPPGKREMLRATKP